MKKGRSEKLMGEIELAVNELEKIGEEIRSNSEKYKVVWEQRNKHLASGDPIKAAELEKEYYFLSGVVSERLDQERIQAVYKVDELKTELEQAKRKLENDCSILERQERELDDLEKEYEQKLRDKQSDINYTKAVLEQLQENILRLEGEN